MGKVFDALDGALADFIERQHMFFVASAPNAESGLLNLSPKGLDSFRILDPQTVAYVDLVGSGIETVAHLKQNGRIVIAFCAFEGKPKIVRLHGIGQVIEPHHREFQSLLDLFPNFAGVRSIIRVRCKRISDSCGFGVPRYEFQGHRQELLQSAERKGESGLRAFQVKKNSASLDGLPGITLSEE